MSSLLVTVGSTCFPKLTDFISRRETLEALSSISVSEVTIQHGSQAISTTFSQTAAIPELNAFSYCEDLRQAMSEADVIVSHAGSGTILEALNMRKKLVVVVNASLMHNHQTELAEAMVNAGCCKLVYDNELDEKLIHAIRDVTTQETQAQPPQRVPSIFAAIVAQEARQLRQ